MAAFCLIIGFCLISSALEIYNPIYLNHQYLFILAGPLMVMVVMGSKEWLKNPYWIIRVSVLLALGIFVAFMLNDLKMSAYLIGMGLLYIFAFEHKFFKPFFVLMMVLPVVTSIYFQVQTKNYSHFKNNFNQYVLHTDNEVPIITNNFVYFSKDELLIDLSSPYDNLCQVEDWDRVMNQNPSEFKLFIYKYYHHAYPAEQEFITSFESWVNTSSFQIVEEFEDEWIQTKTFRKKPAEGLLGIFLSPGSEDSVDIKPNPEFITGGAVAAGQ
jgi:hypothetical protein